MKWLRLYYEARHDPKVQKLRPELFKVWINLLLLAGETGDEGSLPPDDDLPFMMGMRSDVLRRFTDDLVTSKLLVRTANGRLKPHGWDDRQRSSDDAAKRKRQSRSKTYGETGVVDVTGQKSDCHTSVSPRARKELDLDSENSYTHTGENSSTLASTENPDPLPSTPQRGGDDARQLAEAERLLGSDIRTESLGIELSRNSNTPELICIEGWRWLRASERILGPGRTDSQRTSLPYLAKMARGLAESEREPVPVPANGALGINGTPDHGAPCTPRKPPSVARREAQDAEWSRLIKEQEDKERTDGDG